MQRATEGRPAYSERRASLWQYWQSILYVCTCRLCGKLIGWIEGFAPAGWRLHDETARKTRMARSTSPSAPTPAFAPIGSRSPSGGLSDACEGYTRPATASMLSRRSARKRREGIGGRPGRVLEVGLGVGERDERGLELRGRQEHTALAHPVEVAGVARGVGALRRRIVGDGTVAEERREHRADTVDCERDTRLPGALREPALEHRAARLERCIDVVPAELAEGGQAGSDGERVPRQCARLVDRAERRHLAHELPRAPVGADGEPAADDLAEAREIGTDAVESLGPTVRHEEPRDDLVEDQERTVRARDLTEPFEEARKRRDDAHVTRDWLDDDRGDLVTRARKSARSASRSLNGALRVSAASGAGTPPESGIEKVAPPDPAFTSRLSAWPW